MHNTRSIFQREIRGFFNSPMAYIFLVIFSIFNGYFFTSTFFLYNQSDLRSLFSIVPMVYLIFIPAISMGLIARENNIGTMETIATLPIKTHEFVLGKYFAAVVLILLGLLATIIHFFTLVKFGTKIDYGALFTEIECDTECDDDPETIRRTAGVSGEAFPYRRLSSVSSQGAFSEYSASNSTTTSEESEGGSITNGSSKLRFWSSIIRV